MSYFYCKSEKGPQLDKILAKFLKFFIASMFVNVYRRSECSVIIFLPFANTATGLLKTFL